ncbi:MAG: hypothetical protein ACHREM_01370 [Polyangiales bacterium]
MNPIGGLVVAIPFAVFTLHYPAWVAWASGVPLAYVQVIAIDVFWTQLIRMRWWCAFLERRRSPRVEKLVASKERFWTTVVVSPIIGPWLVMAFMRYAQIRHRAVALPLLLGLAWSSGALALACAFLPRLFHQ